MVYMGTQGKLGVLVSNPPAAVVEACSYEGWREDQLSVFTAFLLLSFLFC